MGCSSNVDEKSTEITVATLNYSTIALSPFEFYEKEDKAQQLLNLQMIKMLEVEQKNQKSFDFEFSYIDKNWKKGRYSPLYDKDCGIMNDSNDENEQNDYLVGEQQFRQQWQKSKQSMSKQIAQQIGKWHGQYKKSKTRQQKKTLQQLYENLKVFDLLIYKSIIYQIYRQEDEKEERRKNFEGGKRLKLDVSKYKKYMEVKFNKCYLDQQVKISKVIDAIFKLQIDVIFMQETTEKFVNSAEKQLEGYRVVKCQKHKKLMTKNVIIVRLVGFPMLNFYNLQNNLSVHNIDKFITKSTFQISAELNQLNYNNDTLIQFIDNLILICMNVNPKKQVNKQIIQKFKSNLKILGERFPDCHIVLAGSLNCQEFDSKDCPYTYKSKSGQQVIKYFNVFPNYKQNFTEYSKRTSLQTQQKRTDIVNCAAKDYIVTDMRVTDAKISTINGAQVINLQKLKEIQRRREKGTNKWSDLPENFLPLIPNEEHPYDRFLVIAKMLRPDTIPSVPRAV